MLSLFEENFDKMVNKKPYEKPELISLTEQQTGRGQCISSGNSNNDSCVFTGGAALNTCESEGSAVS